MDDAIWDHLESSGKNGGALRDLVRDMRKEFEQMQEVLEASAANTAGEDEPLPAEVAMEESAKFVKGITELPVRVHER